MFGFSNYLSESRHYNGWKKLVNGEMKDEPRSVAVEEFVGLTPKIYSFLTDDNSENKKAKYVNKSNVAVISRNEYKDVFLITNVSDSQWMEFKVNIVE